MATQAIGEYEFFMFVAALVCSFWINGIIQSFLPLFRNNQTFNSSGGKSAGLFNVFLLISIFTLFVVLLLAGYRLLVEGGHDNAKPLPFFPLLLAYVFFSSPAYLIEYIYLLKNKPGRIVFYGMLTFTLQLLLVAGPAILGLEMDFCIAGMVTVSILRYGWLIFLIKKHAKFEFSGSFLKEHLHLAMPLIVSSFLGSSAMYVDGFLVINKFDTATFAVFRYGAKELPLVLLMANALSNAMIPEFSERGKMEEALSTLRRKSARLMHLLFPATILLILFSHRIYPVVFNENFAESAGVFNIYLLLIISRLVFPHTLLIGMKKTKVVMNASLAELAVNVILSVIFLNRWGIEGVAAATFIAYLLQKIIWVVYNKIRLGISPGQYIPERLWAVYSSLTMVVFYIAYKGFLM